MLTGLLNAGVTRIFVVVVAVVASLMFAALVARAQDAAILYGENGTGAVAFFSATSPEGDEVGVSLEGVDGGDFRIDGGALRFKSSPDFENPTDADGNNEYEVTVRSTDVRPDGAKGAAPTSTLDVVVTVTNVEEAGTATIDWRQPEVTTALAAVARDPDHIVGAATFEWSVPKVSRPTLTNDSHWQDPGAANNDATYTPTADDEGKYLRVKATYDDMEGGDKVAYVRSGFQVRAEVEDGENDPPVFDGDTDDRDIAEDADVGDAVGNPVVATDPNDLDGGKLTYTIDAASADAGSFSIDKRTGQVRVVKALDHEAGDGMYVITVVATDPSGGTDTIPVTIMATDVDEAPSVKGKDAATDPATSHKVNEDANLLDEADLGDAVKYLAVATDVGDVVSLSLDGDDAPAFELVDIDGTGVGVVYRLSFKAAPNFESPTDANKDNAYRVKVVAKDDAGHNSKTDVTVTVTNLDEYGKVSLSSIQPGVGTALTATLKDPDGGETDIRWQWSSWPTRDGVFFEDIEGATSASYTPTAGDPADDEDTGDIGNYLRVTVTYNDAQGPDDTSTTDVIENQREEMATSDNAVREAPETNNAPELPAGVAVDVKESVAGGGNVGDPVKATDDDDDVLTYSLSGGADKDAFGIVPASGQITVGDDTKLDYETRTSYMVEVKAEDPFGMSDTVTVTITVTDVDEAPVLEGDAAVDGYAENGTGPVATYTAPDPEGGSVGWSLEGVDAGDFTIDGGVLRFKSGPDYERATDEGRDNEYRVTVRATDVRPAGAKGAAPTSKLAVVVKVTNVEEAGTATIDWRQPEVTTALAAVARDPDHIVGAATFEWSVPKVSRPTLTNDSHWQDPGAANNDATYTPTADDEGKYLRVKATYDDMEGGDKVAYVRSGFQVRAEVEDGENDPPVFDGDTDDRDIAEDADVGDAVGNPVVATDPNNLDGGKLTYTIDAASADAGSFSIDKRTGQVRVAKALDHEAGDGMYVITVVATDPSGGTDTIPVTIMATDVDEAPSVKGKDAATDPATSHKVNEDANLLDEADLGDAVKYLAVATDVGDVVSLSLDGDDAPAFELVDIDGTGVGVVYRLSFKAAPNFESPTDANKDNAYRVKVVAKDDAGHNSKTDVTVTVTNLDEYGKVSLSSIQPGVGTALTATLKDPDGGETDIRWQWSSWPTRDGVFFEDIEGATSASYTPTAGDPADDEDTGDIGNYLRVTVTYNDAQGPDDTSTTDVIENQREEMATSDNAVREAPETNNAPEFLASVAVDVKESVAGGGNVGDPVKATDDDDDVLTYSLSGGADKDAFGIVPASGQITVGDDTKLDYETRTSYMVEVKAEDPFGMSDTVMVTITVTDVDEAPVPVIKFLLISGMTAVDYAENGTGPVETYTAQGRGGAIITWSVAGADAGDFTIDGGGVLRFKISPDFENPKDADGNNEYSVTVEATDGTNSDMLKVDVTVTDVVENVAPEFAADTAYRRVAENTAAGENIGAPVAATDADEGDTLAYMLGGADADSFSIDASTGQLMTKAELDYETKSSYTVEVTVTDAAGESDTIMGTINITDMGLDNAYDANENGEIDTDEILEAIGDYFNDSITLEEILAVIGLYFSQ